MSFVPIIQLWEPPTELHEGCIHGFKLSLFQPDAEKFGGSGQDRALQVRQEDYHVVAVRQACKLVKRDLVTGNRRLRCYLFRLPISVRFKIYRYIFTRDSDRIDVENGRLVDNGRLAILRTSHAIYHETSIAFFYSLNYCNLVFKDYGISSFAILKHHAQSLPCCTNKRFDAHLEYPCKLNMVQWERSYRTLTLELGSFDENIAVRRRWRFTDFMLTLKYTDGPLKVYSLTVAAGPHWKIPGFNEKDLVLTLFNGGIEIYGDIIFKGFNPQEGSEILRLLVAMDKLFLR